MLSLIIGFVLVAFTVYAVLPFDFCLNWGSVVVEFLKGAAPVIAALIGIICIFIGIADIKDKKEAIKERDAKIDARREIRELNKY